MEDRYIAAIEISSSKVIGVVGKTDGHGQILDVIALEQERCVENVRYGVVQNLEETSMRIASVIQKLERRTSVAPRIITGVFVGLSGRSLRSIPVDTHISLPEDTEITDDILERLTRQARATAIDSSLEVVDAVPRIYKVGKVDTRSPKGMVGNSISGTFDLIVCAPELKRNINRTLPDKLGIRIEGFVVTALATGHLIPSTEEKRLGCMLVDIGSETTAVTIYKNGCLRYFATIPLGGRNITRDLTTLPGVLEERAEDLKMTAGNAIARENPSSLNIDGVKSSDVSNLVVARSEEIVANIVEQIVYAGMKESDLSGGIICIGGGSRLNGIIDLIQSQSNLPTRRGQLPDYVQINDGRANSAELMEVVSVLYAGATLSDHVCLEIPKSEELPQTGEAPEDEPEESERTRKKRETVRRNNVWMERLKRGISGMFGNSKEDDSDLLD